MGHKPEFSGICDNPRRPLVTLGRNQKAQLTDVRGSAKSERYGAATVRKRFLPQPAKVAHYPLVANDQVLPVRRRSELRLQVKNVDVGNTLKSQSINYCSLRFNRVIEVSVPVLGSLLLPKKKRAAKEAALTKSSACGEPSLWW
jgi:hypothetical protein